MTFIICAGTALSVVVLASFLMQFVIFFAVFFSDLTFLVLLKARLWMGVVCLIACDCTVFTCIPLRFQLNLSFFVSECISCPVESLSNGHSKTACIHWVVCWSENRLLLVLNKFLLFDVSTSFCVANSANLMQLYMPLRSWTVHTSRRAQQSKAFTTTRTWDAWKQIPKTPYWKRKTVNPETKF